MQSPSAADRAASVTKGKLRPFDRQPGEFSNQFAAKELGLGYNGEVRFPEAGTGRFERSELISIHHAIHPASANGLSSLAERRRQIRRQRRSALKALASGAGWGAVILLTLWLLLSGIFGFLSA
jgi:hypothetical protein